MHGTCRLKMRFQEWSHCYACLMVSFRIEHCIHYLYDVMMMMMMMMTIWIEFEWACLLTLRFLVATNAERSGAQSRLVSSRYRYRYRGSGVDIGFGASFGSNKILYGSVGSFAIGRLVKFGCRVYK